MWLDWSRIPNTELRLRFAFFAFLLAVCFLYDAPAEPSISLCAWKWLTGHPCPLCGLTRGLCALAKGRWADAVHFNIFSPLVFAALVAWWLKYGSELLHRMLRYRASIAVMSRH